MSRVVVVGVIIIAFKARALEAQDPFLALGFQGPDVVSGPPGSILTSKFFCTLTHSGAVKSHSEIQGWFIGLTATGSPVDTSRVVDISIKGTEAERQFQGGFEQSRVTSGRGNEGAISAVALSFELPSSLPLNATSTIAAFEVESVIPREGGSLTLHYVNGLRYAGPSLENQVIINGSAFVPNELHEKSVPLVPECCSAPLNVGFSLARVSSDAPFHEIAGVGDQCMAEGDEALFQGRPGENVRAEVYANIVSKLAGAGVQGWSLSVAIEGEATIREASTRMPPLASPSILDGALAYERTEVVDPARNGGAAGAVSAVILSFSSATALPPQRTESVLRLVVESDTLARDGERGAVLRFREGLVGSGQPVRNFIVVDGESFPGCNSEKACLALHFHPPLTFVRGDVTGDGVLGLADPIRTLTVLFLGGVDLACEDPADADDDGALSLTDAIFTLWFLFLGGEAPPAPFPQCGEDPTKDALKCGSTSPCPLTP